MCDGKEREQRELWRAASSRQQIVREAACHSQCLHSTSLPSLLIRHAAASTQRVRCLHGLPCSLAMTSISVPEPVMSLAVAPKAR